MCQITVANLGDSRLNHEIFLLLGSIGSVEHSDGWGIISEGGGALKCPFPMYSTTNTGTKLNEDLDKNPRLPFVGHIRKASAQVPVNTENAHPFSDETEFAFVHNGKLSPKDEKGFVLELEVEDLDKEGRKQYSKDNKLLTKKIKRSDSLVFFEKFMENWKAGVLPGDVFDEAFLKIFDETMSLFYGKFAVVFRIHTHTYIARGKTADLYISYLREGPEKDSKVIGWVINTDKVVLLAGTNLLSNLEQLSGRPQLYFNYPQILTENTVYNADGLELRVLGEVTENVTPVGGHYDYEGWGDDWVGDWRGGTSGRTYEDKPKKSDVEKYTEEIYNFAVEYCLSPQDIFFMLFLTYQNSSLEMSETQLKHFCEEVIPRLKNLVPKANRKAMKKTTFRSVPIYVYKGDVQYPWIMNSAQEQRKFLNN